MTQNRRKPYSRASVAALFAALSLMAVSCGDPAGKKEEPVIPPSVSIKTQTVNGEAGSQFMSVTASGNWTISTSASWLTVSPSSGSGDSDMVVLAYSENTEAVRTASVTISATGGTAVANITQNKLIIPEPPAPPQEKENGFGFRTAPVKWLELPETKENDKLEFFSLEMTLGSAKARNYSFDWDYSNLVAPWVAYPLCAGNIGSGSRSDEWGLFPSLPRDRQPVLINAYNGFGSRGHQIPSADRLNHDANVQTFYGVNMTPQDYNFNGGIWAILEGKVREWARRTGVTAGTDTLYVVTGCFVGASTRKARDNDGKAVAVPENYFKALLRYKNNTSVGHKGFMGCAFWFENANKYGTQISKDMSLSIADLEKKLGYKLFVNLDSMVGADTAKTIKEEDPSTVAWWWQ